MSAGLLLTCEHAGNAVPPGLAEAFRGRRALLESHRGWDPGALAVARAMEGRLARRLAAPLRAHQVSRLVADVNRAETHPRVFGEDVRALPPERRKQVLERWHRPHRTRVLADVREVVSGGGRAVHVAVHTFTPVLDGRVRETHLGLLYDPGRTPERRLAGAWAEGLRAALPGVRVHRNRPYRGVSDGLPTWLRAAFDEEAYLGIELEVGTGLLARWGEDVPPGVEAPAPREAEAWARTLAETLDGCLEDGA